MRDLLTGRLQMDRSVVQCSVIPSQSDERSSAAAAVAADVAAPWFTESLHDDQHLC